jgi:hypothetical protein
MTGIFTETARGKEADIHAHAEDGGYKATWRRQFKLPWREAGPPNHLDDKVDVDQ